MLESRARLSEYCYAGFILIMSAAAACGLNSGDLAYKNLFSVAAFLWVCKMCLTSYTRREILAILVVFGLLLINFAHNGEKTLILTAMAVFGAKGVDFCKVLKGNLIVKLVLTAGTITLSACGIIENTAVSLGKGEGGQVEYMTIESYGYFHPNTSFAAIFVIAALVITLFGDTMKWYSYVSVTLVVMFFYRLFHCRTGMLLWLVLCLMVMVNQAVQKWTLKRIYCTLISYVPLVLLCFSLLAAYFYGEYSSLFRRLDIALSGRIYMVWKNLQNSLPALLGSHSATFLDNGYVYILYNYGVPVFLLVVGGYCLTIWYCYIHRQDYILILMGVMAVYAFMEQFPFNAAWNIAWVYVGTCFYDRGWLQRELQQYRTATRRVSRLVGGLEAENEDFNRA